MTSNSTERAQLAERLTVSVDEAAELLGLSPWSVREAVKTGQLPGQRVGRRILIPLAQLRAKFGVEA